RIVDDDDGGLGEFDEVTDLLHLALAEQGGGRELPQIHDQGLANLQVQRQGEAYGFFQARVRPARRVAALPVGMDDDGALDGRLTIYRFGGTQSDSSSPGS